MKNIILGIGILILIYTISSFKKEQTIAEELSSTFGNDSYLEIDTLTLDSIFLKTLDSLSSKLNHSQEIRHFYAGNGNRPTFLLNFYKNGSIDSLINYLNSSSQNHGLNPEIFFTSELDSLLKVFKSDSTSSLAASYHNLAKLELLTAGAYLKYINSLQFGVVNPGKIFPKFHIVLKQQRKEQIIKLLNTENLIDSLAKVQPHSYQYKALQQAYLEASNPATKKVLAVNLERLRWVLPAIGPEYIQVNIPAFQLVYIKNNDTLSHMKVCVGEKKELNDDKKLLDLKKRKNNQDPPTDHETPILLSKVTRLYTNPVWNIPESIIRREILDMAKSNRSYLKKNSISVFRNNKRINNTRNIRWSAYQDKDIPYRFVQEAGPNNALGKLKFFFENNSSIYLHDTNNKKAFKLANRAVSHGCIRLEHPLILAQLLVKEPQKLNEELGLNATGLSIIEQAKKKKQKQLAVKPTLFNTQKPLPLIINYFTAWQENNKIEYRPDVYGYDEQLWAAINIIK